MVYTGTSCPGNPGKLPASNSSDPQQTSHLLAAGGTPESDQFRLS